jgi:hypothetical protein
LRRGRPNRSERSRRALRSPAMRHGQRPARKRHGARDRPRPGFVGDDGSPRQIERFSSFGLAPAHPLAPCTEILRRSLSGRQVGAAIVLSAIRLVVVIFRLVRRHLGIVIDAGCPIPPARLPASPRARDAPRDGGSRSAAPWARPNLLKSRRPGAGFPPPRGSWDPSSAGPPFLQNANSINAFRKPPSRRGDPWRQGSGKGAKFCQLTPLFSVGQDRPGACRAQL